MREIVVMNDLEWQMLSYYVIWYEKFRKVIQQTEKVAFNLIRPWLNMPTVTGGPGYVICMNDGVISLFA